MSEFEKEPSKHVRPTIIEEEYKDKSEEINEPKDQPLEKSRAQIAEEELEKMRHDKLLEGAEEEYKEQSGDYKVGYDQYLKEKDQPTRESETIKISSPEKKEVNREEIEPQEVIKEKVVNNNSEPSNEKIIIDSEVRKDGQVEQDSSKEGLPFQNNQEGSEREKGDTSKELSEKIDQLVNLSQKKNSLRKEKDKQQGLSYRLGIKKKDPQIDTEYRTVYNDYKIVLLELEHLTGKSTEEIEREYLSGDPEKESSQENSPEDENKLKGLKSFLSEKTNETNKEVENLEKGKKGAFEKIKNLMKDKKFQYVIGLAMVGVAIMAPPTGFISMITFGLNAGFLPAALATKATALTGASGGGLLIRGISGFKDDLKKQGKTEVNL
jgi:hypothetical protein